MKNNPNISINIVFVIAMLLRVGLAIVNEQANDDHFSAIKIIKNEGRLPAKDECWSCYHPKLYHAVSASILKLIPVESYVPQIRVSQLINCLAGIVTIYIVYLFLSSQPLSSNLKLICFSLVALNPKFIGINAQATNDSFVIMFSTMGIYFAYRFFGARKLRSFLYMAASTVAATLSKGSGFILFFGILLIFAIKLLHSRSLSLNFKRSYLPYLFIFCFIFLSIVPRFGQYWYNYSKFGSPFVVNADKSPRPFLIKNTYDGYPGVTSVLNSYFTFRLFDLIAHPTIKTGKEFYPLHRTSLWSQLYGRAHFVFFDMCPLSWQTRNKMILNMGRAIFILALVPSFILLLGAVKEIIRWVNAAVKHNFAFIGNSGDWVFGIFFLGYIYFIIKLTSEYRDFWTMKAIYIFPAFLSFVYLFNKGFDTIHPILDKNRGLRLCFYSVFAGLFSLYILTSVCLIYKVGLYNIAH